MTRYIDTVMPDNRSVRGEDYLATWRSKTMACPQVTGDILQCMDEVDDVREYLPDNAVKLLFVYRFLKWLKTFQQGSRD